MFINKSADAQCEKMSKDAEHDLSPSLKDFLFKVIKTVLIRAAGINFKTLCRRVV